MYELQFVVERTRSDQGMGFSICQPLQQLSYQTWHLIGWRCHMYQLLTTINTDSTTAPCPGIITESEHQSPVGTEQIFRRRRIPIRHYLIGSKRITDLLDFPWKPKYRLPLNHCRHLLNTQSIVLNS